MNDLLGFICGFIAGGFFIGAVSYFRGWRNCEKQYEQVFDGRAK